MFRWGGILLLNTENWTLFVYSIISSYLSFSSVVLVAIRKLKISTISYVGSLGFNKNEFNKRTFSFYDFRCGFKQKESCESLKLAFSDEALSIATVYIFLTQTKMKLAKGVTWRRWSTETSALCSSWLNQRNERHTTSLRTTFGQYWVLTWLKLKQFWTDTWVWGALYQMDSSQFE